MARNEFHDVVVVGGGPAGSMAAMGALLADPSLSVCVVERNAEPQHRIGEALLTGTIMALDAAGLTADVAAAGFHRKIGAAYVWGASDEPWYVNYPLSEEPYPEEFRHAGGRYAIHVPRHRFDAVLKDAAIRRGVRWVTAKASGVRTTQTADGPHVTALEIEGGGLLRARYLIDATGQSAVVARGLAERRSLLSPRVARYGYFANVDWDRARAAGFDPHRTNILSGPHGWTWVIHLGEAGGGLCSIGFVSTGEVLKHLTFENAHEAFPLIRHFGFDKGMADPRDHLGQPLAKWYPHPDWSYMCDRMHGPNWAVAGDACVFVDPILSQGVTLATHYGLLRGNAAARQLSLGDTEAQANATRHYRNEGAVLRQVVGEWYGNNRRAGDWKAIAVDISRDRYGRDLDANVAFRWITNLENIRAEYDPFPEEVRQHIRRKLTGAADGAAP